MVSLSDRTVMHDAPQGHTLVPPCIMVDRCGGCCREVEMECVPDEVTLKSLYVYKVSTGFPSGEIYIDLKQNPTALWKKFGKSRIT